MNYWKNIFEYIFLYSFDLTGGPDEYEMTIMMNIHLFLDDKRFVTILWVSWLRTVDLEDCKAGLTYLRVERGPSGENWASILCMRPKLSREDDKKLVRLLARSVISLVVSHLLGFGVGFRCCAQGKTMFFDVSNFFK